MAMPTMLGGCIYFSIIVLGAAACVFLDMASWDFFVGPLIINITTKFHVAKCYWLLGLHLKKKNVFWLGTTEPVESKMSTFVQNVRFLFFIYFKPLLLQTFCGPTYFHTFTSVHSKSHCSPPPRPPPQNAAATLKKLACWWQFSTKKRIQGALW